MISSAETMTPKQATIKNVEVINFKASLKYFMPLELSSRGV